MYLLDTNVLITLSQGAYARDICPGFWDALESHARTGAIRIPVQVLAELARGNDWLVAWAQEKASAWKIETIEEDVASMREVTRWVSTQQFSEAAQNTFLRAADAHLVAQALSRNASVVSFERPAPNRVTTIKIPDACEALRVKYLTPFTMLRELGVRFVLA